MRPIRIGPAIYSRKKASVSVVIPFGKLRVASRVTMNFDKAEPKLRELRKDGNYDISRPRHAI
jgi:hypothetical protein